MQALETVLVQCPHCWEQLEFLVDCSVAELEIIEDCSVCCSPMVIAVSIGEDDALLAEARAESG